MSCLLFVIPRCMRAFDAICGYKSHQMHSSRNTIWDKTTYFQGKLNATRWKQAPFLWKQTPSPRGNRRCPLPGNRRLLLGKRRLFTGDRRLLSGNRRLLPGNRRLSCENRHLLRGNRRLLRGNKRLRRGNRPFSWENRCCLHCENKRLFRLLRPCCDESRFYVISTCLHREEGLTGHRNIVTIALPHVYISLIVCNNDTKLSFSDMR